LIVVGMSVHTLRVRHGTAGAGLVREKSGSRRPATGAARFKESGAEAAEQAWRAEACQPSRSDDDDDDNCATCIQEEVHELIAVMKRSLRNVVTEPVARPWALRRREVGCIQLEKILAEMDLETRDTGMEQNATTLERRSGGWEQYSFTQSVEALAGEARREV